MASYDKDLYKLTRKNVLEGQPKPWMQFAGGALQGAFQGWQQGRQQRAATELGGQLGIDPSVAGQLDPSVLAGALLRSRENVMERGYRSDEADAARRLAVEQEQRGYEHALELEDIRSRGDAARTIIPQLGGAVRFIADRVFPTPVHQAEIGERNARADYYRNQVAEAGGMPLTDEQIAARAAPFVQMGMPMSAARPLAEGSEDVYKSVLGTTERNKRYADAAAQKAQLAQEAAELKRDFEAGRISESIYLARMRLLGSAMSAHAQSIEGFTTPAPIVGEILRDGMPPLPGDFEMGRSAHPLQGELDKIADPAARAAAIEELRANGIDVTGLR